MRIKLMLAGFVCALVVSSQARADDKPLTDNSFAEKVYSGGMTEVALGKIAQTQAKNADVKKFADRVVTDHSKVNNELTILVSELKIAVPDRPLPENDKTLKHFQSGTIKDFDKEFMSHMVKSHEKGVELFTKASKELKNERLRSFAEKTLPTLKEHLEMAKKINDQVASGTRQ